MLPSPTIHDEVAPGQDRSGFTLGSWSVFLALLAAYLGIHLVLRVTGSSTLEFDEAEQFMLVQHFAWGYNTQPPLMTWCFQGLSSVLGESLFTLSILRLGFLGMQYFFLYASARLLLRDPCCAMLVAGALLLIPAVAWDAVGDRVHTNKLCAFFSPRST